MTKHYTGRYITYLLLSSLSLFVGIISSRIELALVALPFLTAVAVSLFLDKPTRIEVSHSISSARFFENDEVTVRMTVEALSDAPLLEVLDPLPEGAELVGGNNNIVTSLEKGERRELSYRFRLPRRARFTLGGMAIRLHAASGLIYWEARFDDVKECVVYPRAPSFREDIRPFHTQVNVGNYVSKILGEGLEFGDLRQYTPGDPMHRINWKASARTGRMHVNEYAQERNCDVVVMVDSFQDVGPLGGSYLDLAARAAAGLSYHLLQSKNRVGFIEYGGRFLWLLPSLGNRQWYRILESLTEMQVKVRYAIQDLANVPPQILPPQSLILALTPLLDDRFKAAMLDLFNRGYDTVALCLSPAKLLRKITADELQQRMALDIWEMEQDAVIRDLQRIGFPILRWDPDEPLGLLVRAVHALHQRRRIS
jgi:uncharacterized protein (DUF58 family)